MEKKEVTIDILVGNGKIVPIYKTQRCTALHLAALRGHFDICKIIFEQAEDKDQSNADGDTTLHYAAYYGHVKICKFLTLKSELLVSARNDLDDDYYVVLLHYSIVGSKSSDLKKNDWFTSVQDGHIIIKEA